MAKSDILLKNIQTHNLKGVDFCVQKGDFCVVTGVSGSGKSSLVFDSIHAEAYRRYLDSFSSFARQYLDRLPKPKLDAVEGLPCSIAVSQAKSSAGPRATVGTMTEVYDYLRTLYLNYGQPFCPQCDRPLSHGRLEEIEEYVHSQKGAKYIYVLVSLEHLAHLPSKALKEALSLQGFSRVFDQGQVKKIKDWNPSKKKGKKLGAYLILGRHKPTGAEGPLRLSIQNGFQISRMQGQSILIASEGVNKVGAESWEFKTFFKTPTCETCEIQLPKPSLALFSFNHPLGACPTCQGFGRESVLDFLKIVPDPSLSLEQRAVAAWNFGSHDSLYDLAKESAKQHGIDFAKPIDDFTDEERRWLIDGDGQKTRKSFVGIQGYFAWLESKKHKMHYRIHAARYRSYVTCQGCEGQRLGPHALSYKLTGDFKKALNIGDCQKMTVIQLENVLKEWFSQYKNESSAQDLYEEMESRLRYLKEMGLSYLSLGRRANTLSGGELQRVKMARCLGSGLVDTLYCLDEPTVGLHPRDSERLAAVIQRLVSLGNTVVCVEHENRIIAKADTVWELGPKAGAYGGELVYAGKPGPFLKKQQKVAKSLYLKNEIQTGAGQQEQHIELKGVKTNNLKNIDVTFPVACMTVVCGVSGSGKSSLVSHTLFPALAAALNLKDGKTSSEVSPEYEELITKNIVGKGGSNIHDCQFVDQSPLTRSSRSNIVTYLKIYDQIRKLMAEQPQAKKLGLTHSFFSFNSGRGRCQTCWGMGTVVEDLSFLGEMEVTCNECSGQRFNPEVLSVYFKGKNILDLLKMTVDEACVFFADFTWVKKLLPIQQFGLGYLELGQNSSSYSGGEAQRVKLLKKLSETKKDQKILFIFDEPTSGLSDTDVKVLIENFRDLTSKGHTVVVVEHHVMMMQHADWLIEIGPEANDQGGELVFAGKPGDLLKQKKSVSRTKKFLEEVM